VKVCTWAQSRASPIAPEGFELEWLSEDFVVGYALALGLHDHYLPKLRAHYQAA